MLLLDDEMVVFVDSLDHREMDKRKNVSGCLVNDCHVTGTKQDDEALKVNQEAVENHLRNQSVLLRHFFVLFRLVTLLLLEIGGHVQEFVDDLKQVVAAPLLVVLHDVGENAVDFLDNVHADKSLDVNFS